MKKINRHFVSDIDRAMAQFNQTHEQSPSQRFEQDKYRRIHQLRDNGDIIEVSEDNIWD